MLFLCNKVCFIRLVAYVFVYRFLITNKRILHFIRFGNEVLLLNRAWFDEA